MPEPRTPVPPEQPHHPVLPDPATPVPTVSRRGKWIGSLIALLVAAGLAWLAWSLTRPDKPAAGGAQGAASGRARAGGPGGPGGPGGGGRPATTVGVAVAERADIPVTLDALGTVVPQATARVRPQVSGPLVRVLFKEGQAVRKGELLAEIDPRPFQIALQQALGARQRNEAQLAAARVTLQRYQTLLQQDSIARQEVDTQAATVRQLEAQITSDKAAEATARLNLAYARIVAPIAGRIGLRAVDVGNVISSGDANGIGVITQMTPIDVEFAVPQDHAAWLQQNAGRTMEVKAFDRTRTHLLDTGVFASVDNQIDTQTGTVRAKARFANAKLQLFPNQFVNVQLQLRTIGDAVVVPVSAVRQGSGGDFVFVLNDNRTVSQRNVVRGQPVGDRLQVSSGLRAGERVITEGADRLRDGSRVSLPGDTPGGQGFRQGGGRRGANAPQGAASAPQNGASAATGGASAAQADAAGATTAAARQRTPEEREAQRARMQNMTPEERAAFRARMQAMSPEERQAARERMGQQRQQGGGEAR